VVDFQDLSAIALIIGVPNLATPTFGSDIKRFAYSAHRALSFRERSVAVVPSCINVRRHDRFERLEKLCGIIFVAKYLPHRRDLRCAKTFRRFYRQSSRSLHAIHPLRSPAVTTSAPLLLHSTYRRHLLHWLSVRLLPERHCCPQCTLARCPRHISHSG
jgi:hypothetical protein